MKKIKIAAALSLLTAAVTAQAQYLSVNISADANLDLQTRTDGSNYPLGGTGLTIAGVPFQFGLLNNTAGTTGAIYEPSGNPSYTFNMPTGVYATDLYTLINTTWGDYGVNEGTVVVTGSHGETATLNLTEGVNVRDQYQGFYQDTLSDSTVVETEFLNGVPNASGPDRLDRQELVLPSSFNGDTVASISFNGIDNGQPGGDPFLAGMTLELVPEPGPFTLFGLGALVLGICRRLVQAKA
jgi:hypothetical protein